MKHVDYKSPGGKLLRVDFEINKDIIEFIKINGDFFVHPENSISKIEEILVGKTIEQAITDLENLIKAEKITLIGFNSFDIKHILGEN